MKMSRLRTRFLKPLLVALCALGLPVLGTCQNQKGVSLEGDKPAATGPPRRWAVVIGVNEYDDREIPKLRYCVSDAKLVAATLATWCGYDPERILVMTHDQEVGHFQPRYLNLVNQIPLWLKDVKEGDTVLIFFSGHGFPGKAKEGESSPDEKPIPTCYLALQDSLKSDLEDRTFKPADLRAILDGCPAKQKILILDCCHSGGVKGDGPVGPSSEELGAAFHLAEGQFTLCSCARNETSHEWDTKRQGLFTWFLVRGLRGAADFDGDRLIDCDELYKYVLDKVPRVANREFNKTQTPRRFLPELGIFAISQTDVMTNSLGMKFCKVSPGTFEMGSPEEEEGREPDERRHSVKLTREFFLGQHEVTQKQYKAVMGTNPSQFASNGETTRESNDIDSAWLPVEVVCWDEAVEFCRRLSERPEEVAAGRRYRLPTEAEWEYACRSGSRTAFHTGDELQRDAANVSHPDAPATATIPVDYCTPNAWGLCGMHGNVREWCADWYGKYEAVSSLNPTGPDTGQEKVLRGGSWQMYPRACRSAVRGTLPPKLRHPDIGFRVVCDFDESATPE